MTGIVRQIVLREDAFLADRHVKRLLTTIVEPAARDFDFERVSAKTIAPDALAGKILTSPMMASHRTLVVDDFEAYFRAGTAKSGTSDDDDEGDSGERKGLAPLLDALKREGVPTHAVFIATKIDKRTAFYKTFSKCGEVLEFKSPYDDKVPGIVSQEASALGIKLDPGVAELLVATAGTDLMTLVGELEKLSIYAHPETVISRRHVQDAVGTGPVDDVFALGNFLGERRFYEAGRLFRRMVEEGEPLVVVVGMVVAHFRKLVLAREAQTAPRSGVSIAQLLKTNPYFVRDYENQAKRFSLDELKKIYGRLMRLSEDLRRSSLDKALLFENFLQAVCLRAA